MFGQPFWNFWVRPATGGRQNRDFWPLKPAKSAYLIGECPRASPYNLTFSSMKLDIAPLISANTTNITDFLSPKFTLIGTILAAVGVVLLGQYGSLTKSLEALQLGPGKLL
ncbi:hypothetical protein C8J56DRAFT_903347 [Mycena floridula]|nr:hypothetical protein C8J56DRAFT_903347 [Mycena floridula]